MSVRTAAKVPALNLGVLGSDGKTFTGVGVKPGSTVTIYSGGLSVGTTTADSNGNWSYVFGSYPATGALLTYDGILAGPATVAPVQPLGPTSFSFATNVASGTTVATITGLQVGETLSTISPADGRIVIGGSGTLLVTGTSVLTPGPTTYIAITNMGRVLFAIGNGTVVVVDPNAASQPLTAAYSMRKVVPGYAGNCIQGVNSVGTTINVGFDGSGNISASAISAALAAGDGTTFTVKTLYDQTANGSNFASTSRPNLAQGVRTNAAGVAMPGVDFAAKTMNMTTTATPIDFSKCVTIFLVYGTYGWGGAGAYPRSPAVVATSGPVVGFGTTTTGGIFGAAGATGETSWGTTSVPQFGATLVEGYANSTAAIAAMVGRLRNEWYSWKVGTLSAGADVRQMYSNRTMASPLAAGAQRLVLGSTGSQSLAHNGPVLEMLVYVSTVPLSDAECQGIAASQRAYWGNLTAGRCPVRYRMIAAGQSLMQYEDTVISASTGVASDSAAQRVWAPELQGYLGMPADTTKELNYNFAVTAIGGSSLLAGSQLTPDNGGTAWNVYDGVTTSKKFWWDQYNNIPGPCAMSWKANSGTSTVNFSFDKICIMWDQGQADAGVWQANGQVANNNAATYQAAMISLFAQLRTWIGSQTVPILIQPIGRQSGDDVSERVIRGIQQAVANAGTAIYMLAETSFLNRQDTVHFAAGPADPLGFDRAAHQQTRAFDNIVNGNITRKYQGPYVASAAIVNSTTIDLTLAWDIRGGGTDITSLGGTTNAFVGFEVNDNVGAKTVTNAARTAANKIRLTIGTALGSSVTVNHNPTPYLLDNTKMVLDNNPGLGLPLQAAFAVAAA